MNEYQICIPTYKRYGNIKKMEELLGTTDIVWAFNSMEDKELYETQPDKFLIGGSLTKNRNELLNHCSNYGKICVMIDDDLVKITNNSNFLEKGVAEPLHVIKELVDQFVCAEHTMGGAAPTDNDYFAKNELGFDKFVCSFMMFKVGNIRFSEEIILKEDYEICANHIKNAGGVLRFNRYMFTFKRYTNEGGCQAEGVRSDGAEAASVAYLHEHYPGAFKNNPKRENEVILNRNYRKYLLENEGQTTLF